MNEQTKTSTFFKTSLALGAKFSLHLQICGTTDKHTCHNMVSEMLMKRNKMIMTGNEYEAKVSEDEKRAERGMDRQAAHVALSVPA